jgi:hypothetical protein
MKRSIYSLFALTALGSIAVAPAYAHISMKGALLSRGGDQKQSPCDGKRGDGMVYTFAPGATITLAVNEDIAHPSYFRVAFDDDGEDFVEPASNDPIDPDRACPFDKDDQCGKSDYCTTAGSAKGAVVLWDNLDPHLANAAKGGTWNVKLPNVECDNCTIQVLQVMEDTVHGAYCPQGSCAASADSFEDIYHRCVDIKLVKGAPSGPGVTTDPIANMGMECAAPDATGGEAGSASTAAGSGGSSGSATAGASASAGSGGPAATTGTAGAGGSTATGKPATTTPSTGAAGTSTRSDGEMTSSGTAGKPAVTSGSAGSAASDTTEASKSDEGGCSVSQPGSRSNLASAALLSLMATLFVARRRRLQV